MSEAGAGPRCGIRSYSLRGGRLGPGQRQELTRLLPRYSIEPSGKLPDWAAIFGRDQPLHAEIGCGYGEALLHYAAADPASDQVAFELYPPGLAVLLGGIEAQRLSNVRVVQADARVHLGTMFASGSLSGLRMFYPDPWPKRRHAKRRLANAEFLAGILKLLRPDGVFAFASDSAVYFQQVVVAATDGWEIIAAGSDARARADRPPTRFELRARKEGRPSYDLRMRPRRNKRMELAGRGAP